MSSCAELKIPEGEIKDFVSNFDANTAYQNVNYGKSLIVNTYYDGNCEVEKGQHSSLAYFDKRNGEYYHYIESTVSGDYNGEDVTKDFTGVQRKSHT